MDFKDVKYGLSTKLAFGKHKGLTIKEVIGVNSSYIQWMHSEGFTFTDGVVKLCNLVYERRAVQRKIGMAEIHPAERVGRSKGYGVGYTQQIHLLSPHATAGLMALREHLDEVFFKHHGGMSEEDEMSMSDL